MISNSHIGPLQIWSTPPIKKQEEFRSHKNECRLENSVTVHYKECAHDLHFVVFCCGLTHWPLENLNDILGT